MTKPILFMIAASILASISQYLFKQATSTWGADGRKRLFASIAVAVGLSIYLAYFKLTLDAYREGDMTILFPLTNLSLLWNLILGRILLGEMLSARKLIGTGVILFGCVLIFF